MANFEESLELFEKSIDLIDDELDAHDLDELKTELATTISTIKLALTDAHAAMSELAAK